MGRGDKKTAKGKRFKGSFGNSRSRKVASKHVAPTAVKVEEIVEEKAPKKAAKKTTKKATKSEDSEA